MKQLALLAMAVISLGGAVWKPVESKEVKLERFWGLEENKGQSLPGVLFQSRGTLLSIAFDAKGFRYSPQNFRVDFLGANPNLALALLDPLPGFVNSQSGPESAWVKGAKRYSTARLSSVWPGVDVVYTASPDSTIVLRLEGAAIGTARFQINGALSLNADSNGNLFATLRPGKPGYSFAVGRLTNATWKLLGGLDVGLETSASSVEIILSEATETTFQSTQFVRNSAGELFAIGTQTDSAGKEPPFPDLGSFGCGELISRPIACLDSWVAKYSPSGTPLWISYLEGDDIEVASFIGMARDGSLQVAGTTNSGKFPVSSNALQKANSGPFQRGAAALYPSTVEGDYFFARMDSKDGTLQSSTFWGGPGLDRLGIVKQGTDGSLYILSDSNSRSGPGMPVTKGSLTSSCSADPCLLGYAARFDEKLEKVLFATYLAGVTLKSALGPDGSVYFAGYSRPGFPVTASAIQKQVVGREDAFVARLAPDGTRLLFGTYWGTPVTDWILNIAVSPDSSVWAAVSSFDQCCVDIDYTLLHIDALGEKVIGKTSLDVGDLFVDEKNRVHATVNPPMKVSANALSAGVCGQGYVILSPTGTELFSTQLPRLLDYKFAGVSPANRPLMQTLDGFFEIDEAAEGDVFGACLVDAATFASPDLTSAGAIVTVWGNKLGPAGGASFTLDNGRVGTNLQGTRILANGQPIPLLYVSPGQVNAILPYSLAPLQTVKLQVERNGQLGNSWTVLLLSSGISLFAPVLNQDGTLNSATNPAKKGSTVVFFGTGGGPTTPPSVAGEVNPLALVYLASTPQFYIGSFSPLKPDFAGAAPGLVAGVSQFNVKLPENLSGRNSIRVASTGAGFNAGFTIVEIEP